MKGRYEDIPIEKIPNGPEHRPTVTLYPDIAPDLDDMYVITTEGDRYDKLSEQFYSKVDFWWIIAVANPEVSTDSLSIPVGVQLRIPAHPEQFILDYLNANK